MHAATALSNGNPTKARALPRVGRSDGERAFRAAARHTRHVRFLRLAIPGTVVFSAIAALAVATLSNPLRLLAKMPIDLGSLVVSGGKIMMQQPRLAGFTRDNRRYDLSAQVAGQDVAKPDVIELQGIRATMEMQDKVHYQATARGGVYNSKTELLTLNEDIIVTSTSGYRAVMSEAVVDVPAGKITSEKPVEITAGGWSVNSNQVEISDSGEVIRFGRGVTVVLTPESTAPVASAGVSRP
jgi:lipopolysaccharide export system protein LptC